MRATPGAVFDYLSFMLGWMLLQVLAIIGELRDAVFLDDLQLKGKE